MSNALLLWAIHNQSNSRVSWCALCRGNGECERNGCDRMGSLGPQTLKGRIWSGKGEGKRCRLDIRAKRGVPQASQTHEGIKNRDYR